MPIIASSAAFLAILFAAAAVYLWTESRRESLSRRIEELAARDGGKSERFARIRERIRGLLVRQTAQEKAVAAIVGGKEISGARALLSQAGYKHPAAIPAYRAVRILLPAVLAGSAFGFGRSAGMAEGRILLMTAAALAMGLMLPGLFLRMRIRRRQEAITDALPDALDLLTVCVEAGLGLNAAFIRITEEFRLASPPLSAEFDVVNREMVAGKPRPEALRALADRTGIEDIKSLVAMLVQTEKLGTSLAQSLRVHSDSLRTRRRQRAEEAAAKTTIKLVFPLVFLLFPALFIVILGPGVIQILRVLFPVVQGR